MINNYKKITRKGSKKKSKIDRTHVTILNVKIDSTPKERVLRKVRDFIAKDSKFYIVTPNPEHVLLAQRDKPFLNVLNNSNISIPDGVGIVAAQKFFSLPTSRNLLLKPLLYFVQGLGVGFSVLFDREWLEKEVKVIHGRILFEELIKLANRKKWKVYLMGGRGDHAKRTSENLSKNYKGVKFMTHGGPEYEEKAKPVSKGDKEIHNEIIRDINKFKPQLLFLSFGAPKQEYWIKNYLKEVDVGGAMVLGGAFEYYSGSRRIPPRWISDSGLEWLWRLFVGSQSLDRILHAFPEFAFRVYLSKFRRN